jgi:predicted AAA+ superfamily ATPase
MIIERRHDKESLLQLIKQFPITLLTGPRQCGKTTLARSIDPNHYFSLSAPDAAEEFLNMCNSQPMRIRGRP